MYTPSKSVAITTLILAVAVMPLAGCGTTNSNTDASVGAAATAATPEGSSAVWNGYPTEYTAAGAADAAALVFIGTVEAIGNPTWNTADRKPLTTEQTGDELPPIIYRTYVVRVTDPIKGDVGVTMQVKSFGGAVGPDSMEFEGSFLPKVGDKVAVLSEPLFTEKNGDVVAIPLSVYTITGDRAVGKLGTARAAELASEDLMESIR